MWGRPEISYGADAGLNVADVAELRGHGLTSRTGHLAHWPARAPAAIPANVSRETITGIAASHSSPPLPAAGIVSRETIQRSALTIPLRQVHQSVFALAASPWPRTSRMALWAATASRRTSFRRVHIWKPASNRLNAVAGPSQWMPAIRPFLRVVLTMVSMAASTSGSLGSSVGGLPRLS